MLGRSHEALVDHRRVHDVRIGEQDGLRAGGRAGGVHHDGVVRQTARARGLGKALEGPDDAEAAGIAGPVAHLDVAGKPNGLPDASHVTAVDE